MAKKTGKEQKFVSKEISHLMKDGPSKGPQKGKKMPQKQAVAVALDVARRKELKTPKPSTSKEESVSAFDSIVSSGRVSQFDAIVNEDSAQASIFDALIKESSSVDWDDRVARTATLAEELTKIRNSVKKTG